MLNHEHPELRHAEYVVFVDPHRRYVDCSDKVCNLLGYRRDEILQKTIDDLSYDTSVEKLFEQYRISRQQQGEYILQHKNRAPVPIYYKAFVFDDGCNAAIWEPINDWREPYTAAMLEVDPRQQQRKIDAALAAIQSSKAELGTQRISDAIATLNRLRKNAKT